MQQQILKPSLYTSIHGCDFPVERFEFGEGIILSKAESHIESNCMIGENERSHSFVMKYERTLQLDYQIEIPNFDNEDKLTQSQFGVSFLIASLMRLKISPFIIRPFGSNMSLKEPFEKNFSSHKYILEYGKLRMNLEEKNITATIEDLEWIKKYWINVDSLLKCDQSFFDAYIACDEALHSQRKSVALITIWGALERIFLSERSELRYRVSLNIATYLEPPGDERKKLYLRIKKLYDDRSKSAHGHKDENEESFKDSFDLLKRALVKIIETNIVPTVTDIESMILTGR
jgi:hypothetical protein